tara:strand:+ start:386 stop:559 length:174 start_codon:yes stop_codon:yes gene_type:complete
MTQYKVYKNENYGDYRVELIINGEWENEFDGNWNETEANKVRATFEADSINQAAFIN